MANLLSKFAAGNLANISADSAGDVCVNDYFIDLTAAQIVAGAIIDMGPLQAGMTVTQTFLVTDKLDSNGAPTITLDVGTLTGNPGDAVTARTCNAEIFSASNVAQAGGVATPTLKTAYKIAATNADRSLGVKINAGAATAAAGRIGIRVLMHATDPNVPF